MSCAAWVSLFSILVLSVQAPAAGAGVGAVDSRRGKTPGAAPERVEPRPEAAGLSMLSRAQRSATRLPRLDGALAPVTHFKVNEAYLLAVRALREEPACAALFDPLGVRGEEALAGTVYHPGGEVGVCLRPALAFTCVGCQRTMLCSGFSRLGAAVAAKVLIHEALHFGGLEESPGYPGAMSSPAISEMVAKNCSF